MASKKKESILELNKQMDKRVHVKFQGGREVVGTLKGFDQLVNLVLDEATEYLRDPSDPHKKTDETRELGLIVCRGTTVMLIAPEEGYEEIENPFLEGAEEDEEEAEGETAAA
eukprot:gb/GECG01006362.1/.p1 GENE.gb/GECG01006362.1/~~gb/GECG01006362.1/.p1  ORF type:complete len:113 (+),score=29.69 gb/GECG01006362.1/:1-339(+)